MWDKNVREFFDARAALWDEKMVINEEVIRIILDKAGVEKGKDILDVACGTGVMIPFYLQRDVSSIDGIDISPEMVKIAKEKFKSENVKFYCDNAADFDYKRLYDCIIIYNAFPHFDEPLRLFEHLTRHLRKGGTLTVCHGMSREKIIAHHERVCHVSHLLPEAGELKEMMGKYLYVVSVISDEKMYLVSGIKE